MEEKLLSTNDLRNKSIYINGNLSAIRCSYCRYWVFYNDSECSACGAPIPQIFSTKKRKNLLKGEKKMVGTPRVPNEDITVSPTRTYVIVIHDLVAENEARFVKIILPDSFENNSKSAKYYYHSVNSDRSSLVIASVAFEDYMATVTDIVEEAIFEPPMVEKDQKLYFNYKKRHFETNSSISLIKDMQEVRQMLDAWNDDITKDPGTTYAMILRSILKNLAHTNERLARIEEIIDNDDP